MRVAILTAMLVLAAAPAAAEPVAPLQPRSTVARECSGGIVHYAEKDEKLVPRRLGELPPGNLILGIVRDVSGCKRPVVVRYGIGAGEAERPRTSSEARRPRARLIR